MLRKFKDYFFRGIAVLLPTILTIWVFVQCYQFVQNNISRQINRSLVRGIVLLTDEYPYPKAEDIKSYAISQDESLKADAKRLNEAVDNEKYIDGARIVVAEKYWVDGPGQVTGFLLALVAVVFVGAILASVVGRALWRKLEELILAFPFIKKVYPYIKQITDFLFTQNKLNFTRVAAVQYPRKGIWAVALVTGSGLKSLASVEKKELMTVFIPSSPTPFTGYVITLPVEDTIMLDMTIEEALRFTISGGVITPAEQKKYEKSKQIETKKEM